MYFCGCNKRITKNHGVENPYRSRFERMDLILQDSWRKPTIKEIHLGGGTPTFFLQNLEDLINGIFVHAKKPKIMSLV
jgi:oxygen-independent coproporphyrinogen-3 oxidase